MKVKLEWTADAVENYAVVIDLDELPEELRNEMMRELDLEDGASPIYEETYELPECEASGQLEDFEEGHRTDRFVETRYTTGITFIAPTREELGLPTGVISLDEVLSDEELSKYSSYFTEPHAGVIGEGRRIPINIVDEALEAGDDARDEERGK